MRTLIKIAGLLFVGVVLPLMLLGWLVSDGSDASPAAGAETPATEPTAPTDPLDALRLALGKDIQPKLIRDVRLQGQRLVVEFNVSANLTAGMVNRGARMATAAIARHASASAVAFDSLFIGGYGGLTDTYGNSTTERVITVVFNRSTLAKINWPNFLHDNIYTVADSASVHQAYR